MNVFLANFIPMCITVVTGVVMLFCYIDFFYKKLYHSKNQRVRNLERAWREIREERELWRKDHFFNFYDPEYQVLWEREIGAEAIYLIYASFKHATHSSYTIYLIEKRRFDTENSV